jgi:hypothetical protein
LSGNWASPKSVSLTSIGSGNTGTDVLVKWPYAFLSAVSATSNHPDLFVYDVTNPVAPVLVKSVDIGAGGINTLWIQGNYLYGASPNDGKELVIFDITTPASTSEVGHYDLTGATDALSVAVFGNTAVVGRLSAAANEIGFVNIANPALPTLIREDPSHDGDVYDESYAGNRLYIIARQSDEDIYIYDITNDANPVYVGFHDI